MCDKGSGNPSIKGGRSRTAGKAGNRQKQARRKKGLGSRLEDVRDLSKDLKGKMIPHTEEGTRQGVNGSKHKVYSGNSAYSLV